MTGRRSIRFSPAISWPAISRRSGSADSARPSVGYAEMTAVNYLAPWVLTDVLHPPGSSLTGWEKARRPALLIIRLPGLTSASRDRSARKTSIGVPGATSPRTSRASGRARGTPGPS